jgi:hypothetical protein
LNLEWEREEILAMEEGHADDLVMLLQRVGAP